MGSITNAIITTDAHDAVTGKKTGSRVSKTKAGVNVMGTAALVAIDWAGVAAGEPQAIGALVVMIGGWAMTLYGRWKADDI